ncbi:MAG: Gram-negative bacterial TonB protein C-terminal [Phycisphaerales bacterium]|nr:Gram-negative bacterial TonB protein C-terminal [Phycisphaerales bacterium]
MHGRHVPIFAFAFAASLVVHAGLYTGTRQLHVGAADGGEPATPRERVATVALLSPSAVRDDSAALLRDLPKDLAPPEPEAFPPEPPPKVEPPPPKPDVEKFPDRIGKPDGEGIGTHAAQGEQTLKAPQADNDQPYLSRDPRGPTPLADPSRSTAPPGQNGNGGQGGTGRPEPEAVPTPADPSPARPLPDPPAIPPVAPPIAPPAPRVDGAEVGTYRAGPVSPRVPTREDGAETPAATVDEATPARGPLAPERVGAPGGRAADANALTMAVRPDGMFPAPPPRPATSPPPAPPPLRMPEVPPTITPVPPDAPPPSPVTAVMPPAAALKPSAASGRAGRPGPPTPAADPAQESESEVDAFSKIEAFIRRDGKVDPQFGREVKTVRPKMLPVSMIDAYMGARTVTLKVRIAPDGHVTSVAVHRSSGSNEVDQPCVVAMYDWWFEPLRNKSGKAVPDTVLFTLNFR